MNGSLHAMDGRRLVKVGVFLAILFIASISGMIVFGIVSTQNTTEPSPNCANPCTIVITSLGFDDGRLVIISKGTAIQWHDEDSIFHALVGIKNWSFSTGIIKPGQSSKSVAVMADGTYDYFCETSMFYGQIQVS